VDGNVYALNAKTGDTRWSQSLGGQILGSTSAVGNIVYVGTYVGTTTYGFAMKDGHKVFGYGSGGANSPVISDGHRIYLTGYSSITALQPLTRKQIKGRARNRREKEARKRKRQAERRKRKAQTKQRHRQRGRRQAKAAKTKQGKPASKGNRGGSG
jgi:hypothetical protein